MNFLQLLMLKLHAYRSQILIYLTLFVIFCEPDNDDQTYTIHETV